MAAALAEVVFDEAAIKAKVNPAIHAADQAYELALKEGIPFREAYRRVASTLKSK
jgi:argininosuccinate lyase